MSYNSLYTIVCLVIFKRVRFVVEYHHHQKDEVKEYHRLLMEDI